MSRRGVRWFLALIALAGLTAGIGFWVWTSNPASPMPEALAALQSDAQVEVISDAWIVFRPRAAEPTTGLILYPGGIVDARAYAPTARAIAAQGYLVVIAPMPFNLAFFGADRAQEIVRAFPTVRRWAIGGHSLGGVAAALFVKNHPNAVQGLVLWASYPADDALAARSLRVVSIAATRDGLSTPDKIAASRALLPPTTRWVTIEGGNHAQFGWYGTQSGDGIATISREEQQQQIVAATVALLESLE